MVLGSLVSSEGSSSSDRRMEQVEATFLNTATFSLVILDLGTGAGGTARLSGRQTPVASQDTGEPGEISQA